MNNFFSQRLSLFFLSILLLTSIGLEAFQLFPSGPHRFYVGPEIYHSRRTRSGGTKQTGVLYGIRGGYDRLSSNAVIYVGLDGYWATGGLNGQKSNGDELKSNVKEWEVEGRLGLTFKKHLIHCYAITPFLGSGYMKSINEYVDPTDPEIKFTDRYNYISTGFLFHTSLSECLNVGFSFKKKFMISGKSKVTDDPIYDTVRLLMDSETQYEMEAPITYYTSWCCGHLSGKFVPFYRFRHYGGRENFPFNFIDTKFRIYGGRIECAIAF